MAEPIRLAPVKAGFLRNRYGDVKVCGILGLLSRLDIVFGFGRQG